MTSPLWAPVTARRAFAPPNEETETSVVRSAGFYCCSEDSSLPWTEHDRTWHNTVHSGGGLVNGRGERNASCALAEHCREKGRVWFDRETWIFFFFLFFLLLKFIQNKIKTKNPGIQNSTGCCGFLTALPNHFNHADSPHVLVAIRHIW